MCPQFRILFVRCIPEVAAEAQFAVVENADGGSAAPTADDVGRREAGCRKDCGESGAKALAGTVSCGGGEGGDVCAALYELRVDGN